jgi:uncharacterized phage-associated protein
VFRRSLKETPCGLKGVGVHFRLDVKKAIQAIGVLFREDRVKRMNYMRLLKLLYVADRESLSETGRPITGGPVLAMPRGPLLEEVYRLIRGQHVEMPNWDRFLRKERYELEMIEDPDVGALSKYEIKKLQEVAAKHANHDEWEMVGITHKLPEWIKNDPGTSSRAIPLRDILEAIGKADEADEIIEEAQELSRIRNLLAIDQRTKNRTGK